MNGRRTVNISAPNLISICVDENCGYTREVRVYHKYSREPSKFRDLNDFLISVEQLMDQIGYPQTALRNRNFFESPKNERKRGMQQVRTADEILNEAGRTATFVVNIQYRQNATWQGKVFWAEAEKSCNFRSALELLKLMDNALEKADENAQENITKEVPPYDSESIDTNQNVIRDVAVETEVTVGNHTFCC